MVVPAPRRGVWCTSTDADQGHTGGHAGVTFTTWSRMTSKRPVAGYIRAAVHLLNAGTRDTARAVRPDCGRSVRDSQLELPARGGKGDLPDPPDISGAWW
jgi:hypothetical protein